MLKKVSVAQLLIVIAILSALYALLYFTGQNGESKALNKELTRLDTATINRFHIIKPEIELGLEKTNGSWNLTLPNGKTIDAVDQKVTSFLNNLSSLSASVLATRQESKWRDYQVDSTGTIIEVYTGEQLEDKIIVGRSGSAGRGGSVTYVRLPGQSEVYGVSGFTMPNINASASYFRKSDIARITADSITALTYNYPADSSFQLSKTESGWEFNNGDMADSTAVARFLNGLGSLSSSRFFDQPLNEPPLFELTLGFSDGTQEKFSAYRIQEDWVLGTTYRPQTFFNDQSLINRLFVSASRF